MKPLESWDTRKAKPDNDDQRGAPPLSWFVFGIVVVVLVMMLIGHGGSLGYGG